MYFFLHLTSRSALRQLGQEKRNKLQDNLAPLVFDAAIETIFGHSPKNEKDGIKGALYKGFNNAEMEYGNCKDLLLAPEDDTRGLDKLIWGKKSKSIVGQLVDNVSEIITGKPNMDPVLQIEIWDVVIEILKKKQIDSLVLAASKENV